MHTPIQLQSHMVNINKKTYVHGIFSVQSLKKTNAVDLYIYSTQTPIQLQSNLVYINRNTIHIYINIYSYVMFTYVNLNMYCA